MQWADEEALLFESREACDALIQCYDGFHKIMKHGALTGYSYPSEFQFLRTIVPKIIAHRAKDSNKSTPAKADSTEALREAAKSSQKEVS